MLHSAKLTNEKLFQAQRLETVSFVGGNGKQTPKRDAAKTGFATSPPRLLSGYNLVTLLPFCLVEQWCLLLSR